MSVLTTREALLTVLDQVDYTAGNCQVNEMVGAVLPTEVIVLAREALQGEQPSPSINAARFEMWWKIAKTQPPYSDPKGIAKSAWDTALREAGVRIK